MWQQVQDGLWVRHVPYRIAGLRIGRQLIAVRLPGGGLWINSPIPVTDDLRTALSALGPVSHVMAPNRWHDECLEEFQRAYPDAAFHASPGLAADKPSVRFTHELSATPHPAWANVLRQHLVGGMPRMNEIVFLHPASRTLILTDLAFHLGYDEPWWNRAVFTLAGIPLRRFAPSRFSRSMMQDRAAVRASLEHLLAWDFDRILVGHGRNIDTDGKAALRRAFAFLYL
ncbi:MAG: DUF4336 domain-containing protein [Opitutae bacterium]|nr:DUF4336 domain-containing protein [Opitutae bacterium]